MDRGPYLLGAIGGLVGALGVVAAAGAAHAAADPLLGTAANMLLFHAAAVLAISALARGGGRVLLVAGVIIAIGVGLFSGDLARRALGGERLFPYAAPIGGTLLILGWIVAAIGCLLRAVRRAA